MTRRELYKILCSRLEQYHRELDLCGFSQLDNGRCFRGIPCCLSGSTCRYLTDSGCSTHSLACLIWLCDLALKYIHQIESNPNDELYSLAKSYLKFRDKAIYLAEKYIPLQQRASEEDTFMHTEEDPQLAEITKWFDDWGGQETLPDQPCLKESIVKWLQQRTVPL